MRRPRSRPRRFGSAPVRQGRFEGLYELIARLAACTDLDSALKEVLEASIDVVGADAGYIRKFETEYEEPISARYPFVVHEGISREYLEYFGNLRQPVDNNSRRAVHEGQRVHVRDMMSHPAFQPHLDVVVAEGYRTLHATPLMSRNGSMCVGVICTYYREVTTPSHAALHTLDLYAELAASTIDRHQTVAQLVNENGSLATIAARRAEVLSWVLSSLTDLEEEAHLLGKQGFVSASQAIARRIREVTTETDLDEGEELAGHGRVPGEASALTPAELAVLTNVWRGLTDEETAAQMGLSRFTVAKFLGAAMRKLNVETRNAAGEFVGRNLLPGQNYPDFLFGDLLRFYRRRAGMTQAELADKAGMSYRTVSDLERGVRRKTYRTTVEVLCSALQLEPEDAARMAASVDRSRRPRTERSNDG